MTIKYKGLLKSLNLAKSRNWITLLHRGVSKQFAYDQVNLYPEYNSIEQFAEKVFFFGEKSKYFWNDKLKTSGQQLNFDINDTSVDFFRFIFNEFNSLIENQIYERTTYYFKRNKNTIAFFKELDNMEIFTETINKLSVPEKTSIRNYYLTILHQLGESKYKDNSQFISSSTDEIVADGFANNEIVINFWQLNFARNALIKPSQNIPQFIGKPYKNQKELSVFTVILPQFIYSFKFNGKLYLNPAISKVKDFELIVLSGLDIKQDNFSQLLKIETNYSSGVETNGMTYQEIK